MVAFGAPLFRLEAILDRGGPPRTVAAAYHRRDRLKKASLDGVTQERLTQAVGKVGAVVFSPGDAALVGGGPGVRRRYLDIVLSLSRPGYLSAAQNYRRALAQRNAALRAGDSDPAVSAWNSALAHAGATMIATRLHWTEAWSATFSNYYERISGGSSASMGYRSGLRTFGLAEEADLEISDSSDRLVAVFMEALTDSAERDRRLGSTQVGPHRDELRLKMSSPTDENVIDLHIYGSGGQRRTAALAFRLVEANTIREATGRSPVLLLDDVFAELDEGRSERVLDALGAEEFGQVILTAPKENDVRLPGLERWSIKAGKVAA